MAAKVPTARIGVDVGGTFTDLVLHDPASDLVHVGKLLTTPDDPSAICTLLCGSLPIRS